MPYVSARYTSPEPDLYLNPLMVGAPAPARQVQATDDQGGVWALTTDSQVGDWVTYIDGGGTIDPYVAPPITTYDVNAERDRRITGGFDFMGHRFQSDEFSQRAMADALQSANLVIAEDYRQAETFQWQEGATEDYYWIAADNAKVVMNAYDVRGLAQNMLRFKQRMVRCARDLKDLDPIPMDYTNDAHWVFTPPPEIDT